MLHRIKKIRGRLGAAIVPAYSVKRGPERTPASRNVRVIEDNTRFSNVPDPIRSSDWTGVGRNSGFSMRPLAFFFNIADIQSVAQDDFAYGPGVIGYAPLPKFAVPRGKQTSQADRINVQRPSNVAYGSLLQLDTIATPPYMGGVVGIDALDRDY